MAVVVLKLKDIVCADFDGDGLLTDWWAPQTSQQFDSRVQCVIDQYSQFEILPGVFVNGKLTQGENIAGSSRALPHVRLVREFVLTLS